jgi:SAM-dependent methyltransferase
VPAAARGFTVTGLDPARASLDLPDLSVDLVTMTGNVAQVFLTDAEWDAVLSAARHVLRPGGRLVFETRDPARRAWLEWNRQDRTRAKSSANNPRFNQTQRDVLRLSQRSDLW